MAGLHRRLFAGIALARPYLEDIEPVCFLDDLTTKNVMVHNGALTGVVDFDCVCYGDPMFQVGLTAASVAAGYTSRCRFYIDELIRFSRPSAKERVMIELYQAVFLVNFLGAEWSDRPGPWRAQACAAAAVALQNFETSYPKF